VKNLYHRRRIASEKKSVQIAVYGGCFWHLSILQPRFVGCLVAMRVFGLPIVLCLRALSKSFVSTDFDSGHAITRGHLFRDNVLACHCI
jgi:hypothetical protein